MSVIISTTSPTFSTDAGVLPISTSSEAAPTPSTSTFVDPGEGFKMGDGDLKALTEPPKFETMEETRHYLKRSLVAALRIFGREGWDLGVAGHLTVRDCEHSDRFWVNAFGVPFRLMTMSDLLLVDEEGKILEGGRPGRRIVNLAGFKIHSAIHKARPDVDAVCHSHSHYGTAFSTLGRLLDITTQDACAFHDSLSLLNDFGGVVVTDNESGLIVKELGQNRAIILQNHGLLTVGTTIQSALAWFLLLEKSCHRQLLADAACARYPGTSPILIRDAEAAYTRKEIASERGGFFIASTYFEVIEKLEGHEFEQ